MNDVLLFFSIKYNGDWELIFEALETKEKIEIKEINNIKNNFAYKYTTIIDKDYPLLLKDVYKPPFLLYCDGNISLLNNNLVTLIGKWKISDILLLVKNRRDVTFVLEKNNINKSLSDEMVLKKLNHILISGIGIKDNNNSSIHKLVLSEFIEKNRKIAFDQIQDRILLGISKNTIIKYNKKCSKILTTLEIGKVERKNMYFFNKCDQIIIDEFRLNKIDNISKIFLKKLN
ncbi:MAG: DNA-processing protein DprA [Mycoplasmoidaceae bacterium]